MQSSTILLIQKMQLSNVTFNVISQEISRLEFCSRMSTGKQWTLGSLVNPGTNEGSTTVSGTEGIQKSDKNCHHSLTFPFIPTSYISNDVQLKTARMR